MKDYSKYSDAKLYEMMSFEKPYQELAFSELYARYSHRIYAYCARLTGNSTDAADVFQETFIAFFNQAKDEKEVTNISPLLFKIAHNISINFQISHRKNVELKDYHVFANDSGFEEKESMEILAYALGLLESQLREAFILRVYQSMEYEEIADLLGTTAGSVRNRVWRAKEKIKEIYNTYMQEVK